MRRPFNRWRDCWRFFAVNSDERFELHVATPLFSLSIADNAIHWSSDRARTGFEWRWDVNMNRRDGEMLFLRGHDHFHYSECSSWNVPGSTGSVSAERSCYS